MRAIFFAGVYAVALLTGGCATYSQVFVNASGTTQTCSVTGQGIGGMATAAVAVCDCSRNWLSLGYVEIERAGVIGITMSDVLDRGMVRVIKVAPASPADSIGIIAGDRIASIDGQPVASVSDAMQLLFGLAGDPVRVEVQREAEKREFLITRIPLAIAPARAPQLPDGKPRPRPWSVDGRTP